VVFVVRFGEAPLGIDQGPEVLCEGEVGGGGGYALRGHGTVGGGGAASGGIGVGLKLSQLDPSPLVQDPEAAVEDVADDLDPAVAEPPRRLPQATVHFDDVVGGHLARLTHDEATVEIGLVVGEAQGASLLPALLGGVASEGFVGGIVLSRLPDYPDRVGNEPVVAGVESG